MWKEKWFGDYREILSYNRYVSSEVLCVDVALCYYEKEERFQLKKKTVCQVFECKTKQTKVTLTVATPKSRKKEKKTSFKKAKMKSRVSLRICVVLLPPKN